MIVDDSMKFCNLLAQMIKEANLSNVKFYSALGIKKPYFYDILSGKRLITVIGDMDLGNYQDNSIDAFGDTYEYLMGMYASNAGKSGGEFFTPQEVSELLTKISLLGV